MKCRRCPKESTGYLVDLCDDCFDAWSKSIHARRQAAGTDAIEATDADVEVINDEWLVPGWRRMS